MIGDIDAVVAAAVAEYAEWEKLAVPSRFKHEPRVLVRDGDSIVVRRPFKSKGHWRVRWNGTARIVNTETRSDMIVFSADWSKP